VVWEGWHREVSPYPDQQWNSCGLWKHGNVVTCQRSIPAGAGRPHRGNRSRPEPVRAVWIKTAGWRLAARELPTSDPPDYGDPWILAFAGTMNDPLIFQDSFW